MAVHNLPYAAAPFVNRVSEIADITHQLSTAACRMLTLVGPGGIGKTRLAMRVTADCADQFDDGVYYVPLQPLESPEFIVSSIADVVGFRFSLGTDPKQQLLQYLREKALLLVLDNFEHLLEGADLLTEILAAAPDLKLLVTSREVLNLQEEWLYTVRGLHFPERNDSDQPGAYSAVQLFVERARQVRGDLSLADEQAAVVRVCQLVEGMPLALELAAVWAKSLPTDEIAVEIQRNLDFLSTPLRNVPQRHQSIQAVFQQTWQRLTDEERRVFRAMSVFSGGFRREAAEAVTGVSTRVLSGLVEKSLLTRGPSGRYQIHELLRQYARARLEVMPDESLRIHELHAAYYARFLDERDGQLSGGNQRETSLEIEAEIDNVRAAWSWAAEHSGIEVIEQAEHPLLLFYTIQSRFLEGADAFAKALELLDIGDPRTELLLAKVLCNLGWTYLRQGELDRAKLALGRSWQLYVQHDILPPPTKGSDPRVPLGLANLLQGNISTAETLNQNAVRDHTPRKDAFNLAFACCVLAMTSRAQGNYQEARQYAEEGYSQTLLSGDEVFAPYCLLEWALASQLLGDTEDAKRRLQAGYVIRKNFGDPKGMADLLNSLGRLAWLEGEHAEAGRYYEQALALYQKYGDHVGLTISLEGMGTSASAMGHYGDASRYLREALQRSSQDRLSRTPSIFVAIGELFLYTGKQARGIELMTFALHHPAVDQDTKDRAQRLLKPYPTAAEAAQMYFRSADFAAVIVALLDELARSNNQTTANQASHRNEALIEPLSERESAILILIANGLPNRQIADQLFLSVATVKWYITHIYGKLGVESRTLALVRARELNLLP